jgi:hypothetical protein
MRNMFLTSAAIVMFLTGSAAQAQLTHDSFRDAHVSIMSAGSRAANVARIRHVPSVTVVDLHWRLTPRMRGDAPEPAELEVSAQKNAAGVRRLQAALRRNPATRAALAERGISVGHVVGVRIFSSGALIVYVL